jgi:protein TonB
MSLHLLALAVLLAAVHEPPAVDDAPVAAVRGELRWIRVGDTGGGGGGREGARATAAYREEPVARPDSRRATMAPRRPRSLNFDDLEVPDLPLEAALLLDGVFSPDALEFPGLSPSDSRDWGGFEDAPSAGSSGGIGDGDGIGAGPGRGPGAGPGSGGGCCGGDGPGGGWDTDPVPIFKPPDPSYPPLARQKRVTGEVILRVLVKVDGSTEVVGVLKSLPHCVDEAVASAKLWRWKPARRDGKPVEALGIITVTFNLFAQA